MTFINLHRHSMWSILDGSGTGDQYAKRAVELNQGALAITDHGTLAGCLEHAQACKDAGIMPIMGIEVYFRENRLDKTKIDGLDKNGKKIKKLPKRFHLTLLAKNYQGWLNIQRLSSEAYRSGLIDFSDRPCVDWDLLNRYKEGVYCLGGCFASILSQDILEGGARVDQIIKLFRGMYGDNFSLELMPHDWDEQRRLGVDTVNVANQYGIPLSATGDTHYPFKEWATTQDVLLMLNTGQTHLKQKRKRESGEEVYSLLKENPTLYLMGEHDIAGAFAAYHPDLPMDVTDAAIHHTGEIIKDFVPFYLDRTIKMPNFSRKVLAKIDPMTAFYEGEPDEIVKQVLRRWAMEGLEELKGIYPPEHWEKYPLQRYINQIEHELDTFDQVGAHSWRYMMMVGGEVRFARREGIVVGPGRGSAAGCLVAYLIGITRIDPISYDLMFERFINPNRKGMPDIDIDFMPGAKGRDLVEKHTGDVYNEGVEQNVIKIAAYQTFGPKAALRGVCRVFDDVIDYSTADRYAKVLDALKATDKFDLPECAKRFPEIAEFQQRYPMLWEQAVRIEGSPSTHSTHASGVLVKPTHISVPTATKKDKDTEQAVTTTAWPDTRELLAGYGFLKIDYLVIEGLVRQHEIMKALKDREGIDIDLDRLPIRWDPYGVDPEVMDIFHRGMTLGVWQFEGRGTIPVLKAVRPDNMHDIAAINALIRPGPRGAGMTEEYAKRKHGQSPIVYWHESVEPVLKNTYGLMIYQEQMMEIAVQLGDFTRTEADDLRKAMGKKYREGLAAVIKFLDDLGFGIKFKENASRKVGEEMAIDIWENKCLPFGEYSFNASHAYSYGAISYHDALFKKTGPADFYSWYLSMADSKDLATRLGGALREGSRFDIQVRPPDINRSKLGFSVLDRQTIQYGIESVKGIGPVGAKTIFEQRPFRSFEDFRTRVPAKVVDKNARSALIGAGAFDEFGLRALMAPHERANEEEKHIGLRLSGAREVDTYRDLIEETIHTEEDFNMAPDGASLCVGGEVIGVKITYTKAKHEEMAFVTVAYGSDTYRVTLFANTWAVYQDMMQNGKIVFFEGKKDVSEKYGEGFVAYTAMPLEELVAITTKATK